MITPQFEVKQTDEELILIIRAPYARVSSEAQPEVHVESYIVTFYASPYYLRLTFSGELVYNEPYHKHEVDGDPVKTTYDASTGCITVCVKKAVPGEYFEDLNMLTKLLAKPSVKNVERPKIEVIGEEKKSAEDGENGENEEEDADDDEDDDDDDDDFYVEQEEPTLLLSDAKYGFANQQSGVLNRIQSELWEVFDVKDPDTTPHGQRRTLRIEDEVSHFCDEHYLGDLYEDEAIRPLLEFETKWAKRRMEIQKDSNVKSDDEFSSDEIDILKNLPWKEFCLSRKEKKQVVMGLVDILFAYAYNHRITEGENTVSSGWTVCKLSATLSWFDAFKHLSTVVKSCFQRSLCYPLYRNWQLSEKVLSDVKDILALGKATVLKCLIELRRILVDADQHYILNDLYITDYCIWIQTIKSSLLDEILEDLKEVKLEKSDLDIDLLTVEEAGKLAMKEAKNGETEDLESSEEESDDDDDSEDEDSDDEDSEDKGSTDEEDSDDQDEEVNQENIVSQFKNIQISESRTSKGDSVAPVNILTSELTM